MSSGVTSLGLDIGGTAIKAVRITGAGAIEATLRFPRPEDPGETLAAAADAARRLRTSATAAVGVGLAGLVRWPEGVFVWGPHLPGEGLAVRELMAAALGMPVAVDNDANCAALAELTVGGAVGVRHAIFLTFGAGIGAGIVIDGAVYRGMSFAGEAGHMALIPDGDRCRCGRRGCWETLVSGSRFDEEARRLVITEPDGVLAGLAGEGPATGAHLTAAAEAGDSSAREVFAAAGRWLGRGVANLVALLDPELVVVGGAAAQAGEWLLAPARREVGLALEGAEHRRPVRIEAAVVGPWAGAVGAGLLAGALPEAL